MSSKRDWNDVSDSDSESEGQQQIQEPQDQKQQHQQVEQIPSLSKIVSSPLPDKKSSNEQQNLLKLENCPKQEVWLYAPLYYRDNIEDIDKIIRSQPSLRWNVLVSRETAKQFIADGKREGKFWIKFYFSNKNEQNNNTNNNKRSDNYRNDYDNKKVKYIPKSPNGKNDFKNAKSPDSLRRIQSQQQYVRGGTPKSPNYKNQQWKKQQNDSRGYRQKNYNNPNNRQGKNKVEREESDSLGKERNNFNKGYKPKYTNKNEASSKHDSQYALESPKKKYVQKQQQQPKTQSEVTSTKPEAKTQVPQKQQPEKKQQKQSPQTKQENDQEDKGSPNEKKAKRKNKKKNELLKDNNNPFSMLNGI